MSTSSGISSTHHHHHPLRILLLHPLPAPQPRTLRGLPLPCKGPHALAGWLAGSGHAGLDRARGRCLVKVLIIAHALSLPAHEDAGRNISVKPASQPHRWQLHPIAQRVGFNKGILLIFPSQLNIIWQWNWRMRWRPYCKTCSATTAQGQIPALCTILEPN